MDVTRSQMTSLCSILKPEDYLRVDGKSISLPVVGERKNFLEFIEKVLEDAQEVVLVTAEGVSVFKRQDDGFCLFSLIRLEG